MTGQSTTMTRIFCYEVPADDQWHDIELTTAQILGVAARTPYAVEFWVFHTDGAATSPYRFRVVRTGHPLGELGSVQHVGVAVVSSQPGLVWHLLRKVGR